MQDFSKLTSHNFASKQSGHLGDAALLVDPKSPEQIPDAINKLYNSPDLRKTFIERGSKNHSTVREKLGAKLILYSK